MTKRIIMFVVSALCIICCAAREVVIKSPDGSLKAVVSDAKGLHFSLFKNNTNVVKSMLIGLSSFDGTEIGAPGSITSCRFAKISKQVNALFYRKALLKDVYNQATLTLKNNAQVTFRLYNEGLAYRFSTNRKDSMKIRKETADLSFSEPAISWMAYTNNPKTPFAMAFQNIYSKEELDTLDKNQAFLPVTIETGKYKVTLLESDVQNYPNMWVQPDKGTLKALFAPYPAKMAYYPWRHMSHVVAAEPYIARVAGQRNYPWRILAVTDDDTQMPVNDLVYLLAEPSKISNTSWIKPGKVAWDWWSDWNLKGVDFKAGINTQTYKYYIDFAAAYHIPYIILDEGWYDSKSGDMMHPIQAIDLPELISYGKNKGVGIVLWTVFNVLDENLETLCKHYSEMGIKGFKVDFMDRDDQTAVEMTNRIAACAAKYHLILDYHGIYKPVGLNRTWPNVLNIESVYGMEESKWETLKFNHPLYDVTFPYIRMMAGPVDYTPGAMRNGTKADWAASYAHPVSQGTRCHQAAMYVVYDSPFTMLADTPTSYQSEPDYTKFIASLPDLWDDTRILQGKMGEYIVTARRKGANWYIAGMTNWDERDITLDLSELLQGSGYTATLLTDGINANHNAEDYKISKVNPAGKLALHMASGGGFVLKIEKNN